MESAQTPETIFSLPIKRFNALYWKYDILQWTRAIVHRSAMHIELSSIDGASHGVLHVDT